MASRATKIDKKFSIKLKTARNKKELSRRELAIKLGISQQQLEKYEMGINRISPARLIDVAKSLDVNFLELVPEEYVKFDNEEEFYTLIWNRLSYSLKRKLLKRIIML
jgi:transcriptional regulator with XRE-family HTH domain